MSGALAAAIRGSPPPCTTAARAASANGDASTWTRNRARTGSAVRVLQDVPPDRPESIRGRRLRVDGRDRRGAQIALHVPIDRHDKVVL